MPPKRAAKKAVAKEAVAKKAVAKKSPTKKAVAKESPAKEAVAKEAVAKKATVKKGKKKTPPVKAVVPVKPSSPSKFIKSRHVRESIPKAVPTDITTLVSTFLHNEIKQAAGKLYDDLIPMITNPKLVNKEQFINVMTDTFVETLGPDFKSFIAKYHQEFEKHGFDAIYDIWEPIVDSFRPTRSDDTLWAQFPDRTLNLAFKDFVINTLELMGQREGFFESDIMEYLDPLMIDDPDNSDTSDNSDVLYYSS